MKIGLIGLHLVLPVAMAVSMNSGSRLLVSDYQATPLLLNVYFDVSYNLVYAMNYDKQVISFRVQFLFLV